MCLITVGKASAIRNTFMATAGVVEDVYTSNRDGFGIMYAGDKGLVALKALPKSAAEAVAWLDSVMPKDDRQVAVHARMATHGVINLAEDGDDNTHPYAVDGGYLMHNGILQISTAADKSRSDTWHYCREYLEGSAHSLFRNEGGRALLGDHIGNNRFVFLAKDGLLSVVNEDQGVHHEGLWFSNTYAWSPELLIPGYQMAPLYNYRFASSPPRNGAKTPSGFVLDDVEDDADYYEALMEGVARALSEYDSAALAEAIDTFGIEDVYDTVESWGPITEYRTYVESEHVEKTVRCVKAWTTGDVEMLAVYTPQVVAESLVLYCDWTEPSEFDYDERAPRSADEVDDAAIGWSDHTVGVQ